MTLNQNYSAVIATTPDYFGRLINLENLHSFCIKHNLFLFVDYAHGAHLHKLDIEKKYLQIKKIFILLTIRCLRGASKLLK